MNEQPTCPACRTAVDQGDKFCGHCGFKLSAISEAAHRALISSIEASPGDDALDPLPALSGASEIDAEGDTHADVYAETMAAGEAGAAGAAKRREGIARADEVMALEQTSLARPVGGLEHDPALDDTALQRSGRGAAALLEPAGVTAALAPAAALPGTNAGEEGEECHDATAGGTLSYGASPVLRPAPLTARQRAANPSGRRMSRYPFKVEVSYTSAHNFYTGVIENVSSGGIFIATDQPGAIGEEYEVSFTVPGINQPCQAVCQVRWIRAAAATGDAPGMGLKFVRLAAPDRAAIELFLNHREPILYEE